MKEVIGCNPLQSVAIRFNQVQSGPIAHPLLTRGGAIRCNQVPSARCNQVQSGAIRPHRPPVAESWRDGP